MRITRPEEQSASFAAMNIKSLKQLRIPPSQTINISNNEIESLSGLPKPEIIKTLLAANNNLTKIEEGPLQHCRSLVSLDLSHNHIQKIENLFYLHHLHFLNLSHNVITVVENLEGLVNLRQLNLCDNGIHSVFVRSPLPRLAVLDLSGNKFKRLMGLNVFPCLSTLRIDRCVLTSLSGLQKQLNLRRISASNNAIVNFQPFYLPLLSHVDIDMNRITSLSCFTHFQSLVRLEISGNPLDDDGIGINCCFQELKEFRADGSKISDPSLIASIAPNVVIVSLTFAKIDSIANVKLLLANAKELLCLDIRGNPVNSSCYPDLEGLAFGDALKEYESEEAYDAQFRDTSKLRTKYRRSIQSVAESKLVWLDGIRIAGTSGKSTPAPSRMNFQFTEEVPVDIASDDLSTDCAIEPPQNQEIQCDLICSSSDDPVFVEQGLQTERMPVNYQYPPTRKIFATDSESDTKKEIGKYVTLTDDEDIAQSPPHEIPPRRRRSKSDESSSSFVSSDSGPVDFDIQKLGMGGFCPIPQSTSCDFSEPDDANQWDKYSAATDLDSELFHVFESPHPVRGRPKTVHQQCLDGNDASMTKNKGGVAFWVSVPTQEPVRKKSTNIPPFRNRPHLPRDTDFGHYPFNTKSARRLPWDNEPEKPPEPGWRKPKSRKANPVRGPHRPPVK